MFQWNNIPLIQLNDDKIYILMWNLWLRKPCQIFHQSGAFSQLEVRRYERNPDGWISIRWKWI